MPSNSAVILPKGETHDYPGFTADPTALDTFILTNLASNLYAYNKLNEPSLTGPYLDSSGNGRTANKYSGYGYPDALVPSCAAITTKAGPSIRIGNNTLQIPTPYVNLGDAAGGQFTIAFLMLIESELGSGSFGATANGAVFISQGAGANAIYFGVSYSNLYAPTFVCRATGNAYAGASTYWNPASANLNTPLCVIITGTSVPGIVWSWDVWINAQKVIGGAKRGGGNSGYPLVLGRCCDNVQPHLGFRVSNVASWTYVVSDRNIVDLTECYMDKAAFASAPRP